MPLPRPSNEEPKPQFLDRCMIDPDMQAEFPDSPQRWAVCTSLYKTDEKSAREAKAKTFTVDPAHITCKAMMDDCGTDKPARTVEAIISTSTPDREDEVVISEGCDYSEYMACPVVFVDHNSDKKCARTKKITKGKNVITAVMDFPYAPDGYCGEWLPDKIYAEFKAGLVYSFSVSFLPMEGRKPSKKDLETFGPQVKSVISKWSLLEISVAGLPMNPDALAISVKSMDAGEKVEVVEVKKEVAPVKKNLELRVIDGSIVLVDLDDETKRKAYENEVQKATTDQVNKAIARAIGKLYYE